MHDRRAVVFAIAKLLVQQGNKTDRTSTDFTCSLQWWRDHTTTYPLFSDIARRLLVIQASSAECDTSVHIDISLLGSVLFLETVHTIFIVLEGLKNKLLRQLLHVN